MNAHLPAAPRVFVIAPALVAWGLERLFQGAHPRFEFIGHQPGLVQCQSDFKRCSADVVVADLDDGCAIDGLPELQAMTSARTVVITSSQDLALLDRCVVAGARGVVRKTDPPPTLLKAVEKVHDGELWIDRVATNRIFLEMARQKAAGYRDPEQAKISTLTSRERQTVLAVATDTAAPGKVIASRMCISEHTLRNHLTSIYSKLGLTNRLDLYAYAMRHSLDRNA
jgi:DNA-binding NarL/FixJ family response regulator